MSCNLILSILLSVIYSESCAMSQVIGEADATTFAVYIATVVDDEFIISCGGSIIGTKTVLTTAHCLISPLDTFVLAGFQSIDLQLPLQPSSTPNGQIAKISRTIRHEKFGAEYVCNNDVAVAAFEEKLTLGEQVSSLNLTSYWARLNDTVSTYGWEHSTSDSQSMRLRLATTNMVCRSKGLKNITQPGALDNLDITTDGVLFVKDQTQNKSLCYGYSGSPLVVGISQIGIASFGIDYDCQGLNAITSIRRHLRWIEKNKALLEGNVLNDIHSHKEMTEGLKRKRKEENAMTQKILRRNKKHAVSSLQPRIRDGNRITSPETFPFLVGIADYIWYKPEWKDLPRCPGSILTQWTVLTAAHCIRKEPMIVYAGIVDMNEFTVKPPTYQTILTLTYRMHENYSATDTSSEYDIGVFLLSEPLKLNSRVSPVCQLSMVKPIRGDVLYITGWGYREDGWRPSFPSWGKVTVRENPPDYDKNYTFVLNTSGSVGASGCPGDSGSPYFSDDHEQAGVHKSAFDPYGPGDCSNDDSVATSVGGFYDWIMKAISDLEDQVS